MRITHTLALLAALAVPTFAMADTIGNALIPRSSVDGDISDGYILDSVFACTGCTVTSYSFYGSQSGTITPILLTGVTSGGVTTFTVVGIGTTHSGTTTGINTFSFGLTSGVDVTTSNTYFGFFNTGGSNVAFSDNDFSTAGMFLVGTPTFSVGQSFSQNSGSESIDTLNTLNARVYSIQATATEQAPPAVGVTPEPASIALLGTGLLSIAGIARRKYVR